MNKNRLNDDGWLFSESQRFTQWWMWVLMIGGSIAVLAIIIRAGFFNDELEPTREIMVLIALVALLLAILLVYFIRLDTKINESAVYYRFFPLHQQFRLREWSQVDKAFVRKYNPILEYGGWGIRLGLSGKGWAYNIAGNKGLQLELKNGKKCLLGTQKSDELQRVIEILRDRKVLPEA